MQEIDVTHSIEKPRAPWRNKITDFWEKFLRQNLFTKLSLVLMIGVFLLSPILVASKTGIFSHAGSSLLTNCTPIPSGMTQDQIKKLSDSGQVKWCGQNSLGQSITSINNIYVSPSGSNTVNDGLSAQTPFATISFADTKATPGTIIHVLAGTYTDPVATKADGTVDGRIVYTSEPKGAAHIVVNSTTADTEWQSEGDYVDIVGFNITGNGRTGILLYGSYVRAIGNIVHDIPAPNCDSLGGSGIGEGDYTSHDKDEIGNIVYNIGTGSCDQVHGIYHSTKGGHIYNNISYNNSGWGIHLWHADENVVIANNISFGNHNGGIVVGAGDSPGGVTANHILVENNIVMDNPYGILETGLVNNTNLYTNNILFRNTTQFRLTQGVQGTNYFVDPLFVNYKLDGTGDYHLKSGSPAIGVGVINNTPTTDIEGNQRNGAMDIGPYVGPTSGNLLYNPSFETGETKWTYTQSGIANANPHGVDCSAATDGSCSLRIAAQSIDSAHWWYIKEEQTGLAFTTGTSYTLKFDAKTNNAGRTLTMELGPNGAYGAITKTLSNTWQTFTYTFTPNATDTNSALDIYFGRQTGTVWVDNVSIVANSITATASPTPTPINPIPSSSPTPTPIAFPTPTPTPPPGSSSNIAPAASVSVSSTNTIVYPGTCCSANYVKDGTTSTEWASQTQLTPWIQLNWTSPQTINQIKLFDRRNTTDGITWGTLYFSDGSMMRVQNIPNSGSEYNITFAPKTITWIKFVVDVGYGINVGLSEFQVFSSSQTVGNNAALTSTPTVSSTNTIVYPGICCNATYAKDGNTSTEWASQGQLTPWIQLLFPTPQNLYDIKLFDRPNTTDKVNAGTLSFSDGSTISVGTLPDTGSAYEIPFPQKNNITWVKFQVTSGAGLNVGLREFQAFSN